MWYKINTPIKPNMVQTINPNYVQFRTDWPEWNKAGNQPGDLWWNRLLTRQIPTWTKEEQEQRKQTGYSGPEGFNIVGLPNNWGMTPVTAWEVQRWLEKYPYSGWTAQQAQDFYSGKGTPASGGETRLWPSTTWGNTARFREM